MIDSHIASLLVLIKQYKVDIDFSEQLLVI